jgi:hypothetical protein
VVKPPLLPKLRVLAATCLFEYRRHLVLQPNKPVLRILQLRQLFTMPSARALLHAAPLLARGCIGYRPVIIMCPQAVIGSVNPVSQRPERGGFGLAAPPFEPA